MHTHANAWAVVVTAALALCGLSHNAVAQFVGRQPKLEPNQVTFTARIAPDIDATTADMKKVKVWGAAEFKFPIANGVADLEIDGVKRSLKVGSSLVDARNLLSRQFAREIGKIVSARPFDRIPVSNEDLRLALLEAQRKSGANRGLHGAFIEFGLNNSADERPTVQLRPGRNTEKMDISGNWAFKLSSFPELLMPSAWDESWRLAVVLEKTMANTLLGLRPRNDDTSRSAEAVRVTSQSTIPVEVGSIIWVAPDRPDQLSGSWSVRAAAHLWPL